MFQQPADPNMHITLCPTQGFTPLHVDVRARPDCSRPLLATVFFLLLATALHVALFGFETCWLFSSTLFSLGSNNYSHKGHFLDILTSTFHSRG